MTKFIEAGGRVMDIAYIRDGSNIHTGEAMMLACLLHAKGKGRNSKDFKELQRIMNDPNYDNATS